ncbi:hypothetical protein LINPERPRIM_LOCUS25081 [Linum perenne]
MVAEKQHFFPRLEIDPSNMVTRTVDLRSDTVTKPCEGMRAAMAKAEEGEAEVGVGRRLEAGVGWRRGLVGGGGQVLGWKPAAGVGWSRRR